MTRLPSIVRCHRCAKDVPAHQARRRVTAWARLGKGGTLSGVRGLETSETYCCDRCLNAMEYGSGNVSLFDEKNGGPESAGASKRASVARDTKSTSA